MWGRQTCPRTRSAMLRFVHPTGRWASVLADDCAYDRVIRHRGCLRRRRPPSAPPAILPCQGAGSALPGRQHVSPDAPQAVIPPSASGRTRLLSHRPCRPPARTGARVNTRALARVPRPPAPGTECAEGGRSDQTANFTSSLVVPVTSISWSLIRSWSSAHTVTMFVMSWTRSGARLRGTM